MREFFYSLLRAVVPEGRLLFRALAYAMLAGIAFALPHASA
jgi:hypothetical protein